MFSEELKRHWGFHPMQWAYFAQIQESNPRLAPARVIFSSHELYRVQLLGQFKSVGAKVRGHFYHVQSDLPVVGDWVVVDPGTDGQDHDSIPIEGVLPRISNLLRPDGGHRSQVLIANANHIGVVTSFNRDLSERRIERALAMIGESGASPIVIINKCDLLEPHQIAQELHSLEARFNAVPIVSCSASTGQGLTEIKSRFQIGETVALIGMSGVGKSTLVNSLIGEEALETKSIRQADARGRHTTTHRELFRAREGFWLIDNPGIREFGIASSEDSIEQTFSDIAELAVTCRYRDCNHDAEPGCEIREAIVRGDLEEDRWQNYLKLKREARFQEHKDHKRTRAAKRKHYDRASVAKIPRD